MGINTNGESSSNTDPLASYNYGVSVADLQLPTSEELDTSGSATIIRNEGICIYMMINTHACAYSVRVCQCARAH